jgi:hypothetical protein
MQYTRLGANGLTSFKDLSGHDELWRPKLARLDYEL